MFQCQFMYLLAHRIHPSSHKIMTKIHLHRTVLRWSAFKELCSLIAFFSFHIYLFLKTFMLINIKKPGAKICQFMYLLAHRIHPSSHKIMTKIHLHRTVLRWSAFKELCSLIAFFSFHIYLFLKTFMLINIKKPGAKISVKS